MTDVFFSYSSKDRERVRPIRDALVAEGFDVFWDREAPPGRNRNEWTRQQAGAAPCVVVFWSAHSAMQFGVAREAIAAKTAGKLVSVLLDPIEPSQLPMKLDAGLGDTVIDFDNPRAGLARLAKEIAAKKAQAASQPPKASRPRADGGPAGPLAKFAMRAGYTVWYTFSTIAVAIFSVFQWSVGIRRDGCFVHRQHLRSAVDVCAGQVVYQRRHPGDMPALSVEPPHVGARPAPMVSCRKQLVSA